MRQVEGGNQTREDNGIQSEPLKGVLVDRRDSERVTCVASKGTSKVVLHVHGATPKYSTVDSGKVGGPHDSWKNRETARVDLVCPNVGEDSGLEGKERVESVGGKGKSSSQPLIEEGFRDHIEMVLSSIQSRIPAELRPTLDINFDAEEVRAALFQMSP
ncbi:hypothetical protein LWI29_014853 [Acer saccharum]|uniref:Uncharacterized protein n=1 Tax=Acer saccharum TaxID=4024 RepID=A0AA39TEN8_ACESA|nr:hypothetical protein LWI29_014853 [Acer saccharum]